MTEPTVKVGGPYVEDENFVPNPTDIHGTYVTDGVGPHHDLSTISPIFEVDKQAVAQQVVDALNPDSPVTSNYVSLPEVTFGTNEARSEAAETLKAAAEKTLERGPVVLNDPIGPEAAAAESGDKGNKLAQAEADKNASETSVPAGDAGTQATSPTSTTTTTPSGSSEGTSASA